MTWLDLAGQVDTILVTTFGRPAIINNINCTVIVTTAIQIIGTFDQISEARPVLIFLRSEIPEVERGDWVEFSENEIYVIDSIAEDHSDAYLVAYWGTSHE